MADRTEDDLAILIEREFVERALCDYRDKIAFLSARCESPIERVLLAALLVEIPEGVSFYESRSHTLPFESVLYGADSNAVEWVGAIYPQVSMGPYRVDFYLECFDRHTGRRWFATAIECDGHDFHEKTKEQARRDKQRDRWFQTRGIGVLRFAGSEIWRDPLKCAEEAYEAFWAASRRLREADKNA